MIPCGRLLLARLHIYSVVLPTPATMSKQRSTSSKQHSTLPKGFTFDDVVRLVCVYGLDRNEAVRCGIVISRPVAEKKPL